MTGPAQGTVAITNVTVHTMDARGTLPAQTVAIEDGRISRMGRAGEVPNCSPRAISTSTSPTQQGRRALGRQAGSRPRLE